MSRIDPNRHRSESRKEHVSLPKNANSARPKCPVCDVEMVYDRQQRSGFGHGIGTDMKKVWRCPQCWRIDQTGAPPPSN